MDKKNVVNQEWLLENILKEDLVVLDVRADMNNKSYGKLEYEKGHIKRAQFVSFDDILVGEIKNHGGRHPLPDMNEFILEMRNLGINDDSIVLIYDDGNLEMAGRLWWMLRYSGMKEVYVLRGGFKGWKNNNLDITTEVIKPKRSDSLVLSIDSSLIADVDEVKKGIDMDNIAIVDSRAYERYIGEVEPLDKIAGHIPKALNYPWMNLVSDDEHKSDEELSKYFKELNDFKDIIVHCGSGITGTVNILYMEDIGLKPKLYVGGYSDWISYEDNQIITK